MKKELTICMPIYNGEKWLDESVGSILSQDFRNFTLLCYDDGSTDGSLDKLKSFKDRRIKIIQGNENRGGIYARSQLINALDTEYCMWMDDDDRYCRADAVRYALEKIKSNGGYDIVNFASMYRIGEDGKTRLYRDGLYDDFSYCGSRLFEKFWPVDNMYLFNSKIFRTEILKKSIPEDEILSSRFCTDDMFFSAMWFFHARRYLHVALDEPIYEYKDSIGLWGSKTRDFSLRRFGDLCILQYYVFVSLWRRMTAIRNLNQAEFRNFIAGVNLPMLAKMVRTARRNFGDAYADSMIKVWHSAFAEDGKHILNRHHDIPGFPMPEYIKSLEEMMKG